MAYTLPANTIIEITIVGLVDGQTTLSIFHYKLEGTVTDGRQYLVSMLQNLIGDGAVRGVLLDKYLDCVVDTWSMTQSVAQAIHPTRYARVAVTPAAETIGAVEQPPLPPATSVCLTKRTDKAGRNQVGHLHMPAVPDVWNQGGVIVNPAPTRYDALGTAVATPYNGGAAQAIPVIYHRQAPGAPDEITSCKVESTVRTMRRRVVGRGI